MQHPNLYPTNIRSHVCIAPKPKFNPIHCWSFYNEVNFTKATYIQEKL